MFLKGHCVILQAAFPYSSFVDVSSGFLNALLYVQMYIVYDKRAICNFMSIQQLRIKQMALYWFFWGGSRSLVMLCLKFVEVRYHRGCLNSLSESLFVLNCQRIQEIICGIFRTIQFQMPFYSMLFMTSCYI